MAVQDEILKIRMQSEGEDRIAKLTALLRQQEAAGAALKAQFKTMDVTTFIAEEQKLAQQTKQVTKEINEQTAALAKRNRHQAGKLSVNDRSVLGFGTAQIIQDVASTGNPAHGINNLLFMAQMQGGVANLGKAYVTMGKEATGWVAKMAAAHPIASAAIAATGAALIVLDHDLKQSNLSWKDLGTVVGNTRPWVAATEAIKGTGEVLGDIAVDSGAAAGIAAATGGMVGLVDQVANLALGWDDAKDAAAAHNVEAAAAAKWAKEAAEGAERVAQSQSGDQKAAAGQGKAFKLAFANLGGIGGAESVLSQLTTGGDEERRKKDRARLNALFNKAAQGDSRAMADLTGLAGGKGMDTLGLENARAGIVNSAAADFGPDRKMFDEMQAEERERDKALRADADSATADARKISVEDAMGGIIGLDTRVDQGLRDRVVENMAAGMSAGDARAAAGGAVAEGLAAELQSSGGLPAEWAKEEAANYVRERGKALRAGAAGEAADPANLALEQLGIQRSMLGLMPEGALSPKAPSVVGAEAFAQQVQSGGGKSQTQLQQDHISKTEALIKINQDIKRVLERGGLLVP